MPLSNLAEKASPQLKYFSIADAARLMGIEQAQLVPAARMAIEAEPLQYRVLVSPEREAAMADVIRALARRKFEPVGEHRKLVWERGWSENLEKFIEADFDIKALRPYFMHADRPFRLYGDYAASETPDVEFRISRFIRLQLFGTYFKSVNSIYEFGAGTGANILELNRMFPDKNIAGLDWAQASVDIMQHLHDKINQRITGRLFDFFNPDQALDLVPGSGVLTSGALEQIGDRFGPFLDYLLAKRPRIVVHMEPILEYYDEALFFDVLAAEYHRQRGYLFGLIPRLREFNKAGKIKILAEHRTRFGSLYDEGYSFIVWEPI